MATNINYAFVSFVSTTGGPLLKVESDITLTDTRLHGIHATGVGTFVFSDIVGGVSTTKIKFVNTTNNDVANIYIEDFGVRFNGIVNVSVPTTASTVAVQYG
jgi:hypothetical protein